MWSRRGYRILNVRVIFRPIFKTTILPKKNVHFLTDNIAHEVSSGQLYPRFLRTLLSSNTVDNLSMKSGHKFPITCDEREIQNTDNLSSIWIPCPICLVTSRLFDNLHWKRKPFYIFVLLDRFILEFGQGYVDCHYQIYKWKIIIMKSIGYNVIKIIILRYVWSN